VVVADEKVTCPNGDMPGNPWREPRPNCWATYGAYIPNASTYQLFSV